MNDVFLVTMLCKPKDGTAYPIFRFVGGTDFDRASYLAGCCIDALADYHGLEFDYSVEPLPYVGSMTAEIEIVRRCLESAV
ncbi:hypothetical protein [Mesorhizobium sp. B2-8-9]|uniref:hypothetical protein n=1 Tax=Mesorhizobium sp. B2-8-9 TaxID=2589899 RepID=UPI00112CBDEC|nr:hypothetical protein [Mesorhizobium sp. B2-8-9]TPI86403.1 hypothetical protein FJ423_00850 [Mesorhizobium sp. B2-8-9]